MADIADLRLTKQNMLAEGGNIRPFAHQLEIPSPVDGVAKQHRALDAIVLDHQFFINPTCRVLEGHVFSRFPALELAGGKQVDAGDFKLGRVHRILIPCDAEFRQMVGADFGLLKHRGDQAK